MVDSHAIRASQTSRADCVFDNCAAERVGLVDEDSDSGPGHTLDADSMLADLAQKERSREWGRVLTERLEPASPQNSSAEQRPTALYGRFWQYS